MSLFDEPEWGSSQAFSYYPEATEISSSLLENSLQRQVKKRKKSDKQVSNKKRKSSNEKLSESSKIDNLKKKKCQKTGNKGKKLILNPAKKKGNVLVPKPGKEKKKKALSQKEITGEDLQKQQNTDSSKTSGDDTAKNVIDKVKMLKKRKLSNKRNKYKELNIEQNKRKTNVLSNGLAEMVFNNKQNLNVQPESKLSLECLADGGNNRSTKQMSESNPKKLVSTKVKTTNNSVSYSVTCNKEVEASSIVNEKTTSNAAKKKKSKLKKGIEIKKKTNSNGDVNISSSRPNELQSSPVSAKPNFKEIGIPTEITSNENSNKRCKKKKKDKQKGRVLTSENCDRPSDSTSMQQISSENTPKAIEIKTHTENIRGNKKAQIESETAHIKKKSDKFAQVKGQIVKSTKAKADVKKKKKSIDKSRAVKCKKDDDGNDLEVEEYDGGEPDIELENDIETFIKKLKFDKCKQGIDISEELSSSGDPEHASDKEWETDENISGDESDEEKGENDSSSTVKNMIKVSETNDPAKVKNTKSSIMTAHKNTDAVTQSKETINSPIATPSKGNKFSVKALTKLLEEDSENNKIAISKVAAKQPVISATDALKLKMQEQLNAARFRLVNEQMYTSTSTDAMKIFKSDPDSFHSYHSGFQSQVSKWPVNPLDLVVQWLKNKPKMWIVADFGCGEAILAEKVSQETVHSFDLVALNPRITVCDMAHTPLQSGSVDVVVFCLSLMGTNIKEFITEANRVLHEGGIMKIAEVESRFTDVNFFVNHVKRFGFHCTYKDTSMKYFFMFEFKKHRSLKNITALPDIILKPCKYKKR